MFYTDRVVMDSFKTIEQTLEFIHEQDKGIHLVPCEDVLEGHEFRNDKWLDDFTFNEVGLNAFAQRLPVKGLMSTLDAIGEPGLASQVLNDLCKHPESMDALAKSRFVVDGKNTVVNVVGNRFAPLSNTDFLKQVGYIGGHGFSGATIHNTRLSLKFLDKHEGLPMTSHGIDGYDAIKMGMLLRNGFGDSSVAASLLVEHMLCTNQMYFRGKNEEFTTKHIGQGFGDRVDNIIELTKREYTVLKDKLNTLFEIEFKPHLLAEAGAPVWFAPGMNKPTRIHTKGKQYKTLGEKETVIGENAAAIAAIPYDIGGETTKAVFSSIHRDRWSMFHFTEAFTEHAKNLNPVERLDVEEKTGVLVNWILANKKLFV